LQGRQLCNSYRLSIDRNTASQQCAPCSPALACWVWVGGSGASARCSSIPAPPIGRWAWRNSA
jgi:hypothetical protein